MPTEAQVKVFFAHWESILWGWPTLTLLIFTGLFLTICLRGLQFTMLWHSLKLAFLNRSTHDADSAGDISHFQALMTALSATVGTGNIAGVATAVSFGGPGALFWMWMTGFLGMATKYTEATLGVYYRRHSETGEMSGGPMYYIEDGLAEFGWLKRTGINRILALIFAFLVAVAAINIGNMIQANSVADAVANMFTSASSTIASQADFLFQLKVITGIVIAFLTGLVIIGGIHRIGNVAAGMVPLMILLYVGAGSCVLLIHMDALPNALWHIVHDAFTGTGAVAGGFLGAGVKKAMELGFSRGVFSNESGLGSAPIVAAAAKTDHPVEQALVSMTQTFIDTIVVCTFTGLIVVVSGQWLHADPHTLTGAALTSESFGTALSLPVGQTTIGAITVSICLMFFAYSTIVGWYYYGEKGLTYIFGEKIVWPYRLVYLVCLVVGAIQPVPLIWSIASVLVAFMIFPNLLCLLLLSGKVRRLTKDYFRNKATGEGYLEKPFHHIYEAR